MVKLPRYSVGGTAAWIVSDDQTLLASDCDDDGVVHLEFLHRERSHGKQLAGCLRFIVEHR
jgi:hypothetical protein